MKQFLSFILFLGITNIMWAQSATTYKSKAESDPQAKAVLDKLRQKYEAFKTMEVELSIKMEVPGSDEEIQKWKMAQSGDNYRLEIPGMEVISNGEAMWVHQIRNKEVQINDVEEDNEDMMSPQTFMKLYEREDLIYALVNEYVEKGVLIQQVEFKPTDKDESEYSKIRLTIDKKKNNIKRIKVFSRDGSRYTAELTKFSPNANFPAGHFAFDASKFPGVHVEDLRF